MAQVVGPTAAAIRQAAQVAVDLTAAAQANENKLTSTNEAVLRQQLRDLSNQNPHTVKRAADSLDYRLESLAETDPDKLTAFLVKEGAVSKMITAYRNAAYANRREILEALCRAPSDLLDREIGNRLSSLNSRDSKKLISAIEEIGIIGCCTGLGEMSVHKRQAIQELTSLLDHSNPEVICAAVNGLGYIGPDAVSSVQRLTELLEHENPQVVEAAAWTLGGNFSERRTRCKPTQELIQAFKNAGTASKLVDLLIGSSNAKVTVAAADALHDLPEEVITSLSHRERELAALEIADKMHRDIHMSFNGATAIAALQLEKADRVVDSLLSIINHPDCSKVQKQNAIFALQLLGPAAKKAVPTLISLIRNRFNDGYAIRALISIGPEAEAAVDTLVSVLKDPKQNQTMKQWALEALGAIGPAAQSAVPAITPFLNHEVSIVSGAASRAIKDIGGTDPK